MRIPQAGFQGTIATVLAGDVCTRCTPRTDQWEGAVGGGLVMMEVGMGQSCTHERPFLQTCLGNGQAFT